MSTIYLLTDKGVRIIITLQTLIQHSHFRYLSITNRLDIEKVKAHHPIIIAGGLIDVIIQAVDPNQDQGIGIEDHLRRQVLAKEVHIEIQV